MKTLNTIHMNRVLFSLACFSVLLSCGNEEVNEVPEPKQEVTLLDTTSLDTLIETEEPEFKDTIYNGLADFFSLETCVKIRALNKDFRSYKSNTEFDEILDRAQAMLSDMEEDLYSTETKFKNEMPQEYGAPETMELIQAVDELSDSLLPIVVECGGECAQADFFLDFENIKGPCRLTPSEADDELVEILRRVYGVYGNLNWHNDIGWREWWGMEYSWYTFGNDYMYDTFTMICRFQAKFPDQFVQRINTVRDELVQKLSLGEGDKTQYSKASILREFNEIVNMDCLSAKNKADLNASIKNIESSSGIQFETEPY